MSGNPLPQGQLLDWFGCEGELSSVATRVNDVMTRKTLTLAENQKFGEAVTLMANQFVRHILVEGADGRLCGVISDRDVLRALARTPEWNSKVVSQVMSADPIAVKSETPISSAVRLMLEHRINCLPVIDADGRACGILTSTDLLKTFEKIQTIVERNRSAVANPGRGTSSS